MNVGIRLGKCNSQKKEHFINNILKDFVINFLYISQENLAGYGKSCRQLYWFVRIYTRMYAQ